MRPLKFVLMAVFCTILATLAHASNQKLVATDPTTIFLTTATGNQILKLSINTTAVTASVVATYTDKKFVPEDLTIGPDNKIYVCSPTTNEIRRMNQDFSSVEEVYSGGTTGPLFSPEGPKFDAFGDLLVNSRGSNSAGVWIFPGIASSTTVPAPTHLVSFSETGEGLAFSNQGTLFVVDQEPSGNVFTVPESCYASSSGCSATKLIPNLNMPTGVARDNFDNIYVTESGASPGDILKFNPDGSPAGTYVTFPSSPPSPPDQPWFAKFAADGTLFVATSQNASGVLQNGKLWFVTPPAITGGSPTLTLLFTVPAPNATKPAPPAIGVAVPATIATINATSYDPTANNPNLNLASTGFALTASFGHDGMQVIELASSGCTVPVTVNQKPPAAVKAALAATLGSSFTANQEPGQEGWTTTFSVPPNATQQVDQLPALCASALSPPFYKIYLFEFQTNPSATNPQIVKCDLTGNLDGNIIPLSGAPPQGLSCTVMTSFGVYPFGALPEDIGDSGGGGTWSEYIMVTQAPATGQPDQFCGFQTPLAGTTITNPDVIKGNTSGIPVKFQAATSSGNCTSGPFDGSLTATISAQLIDPNAPTSSPFTPIQINPEGSSNSELPPLFRFDPTTQTWIFNLKFAWPDGTPWSRGEYAITVNSNKFGPQTAFVLLK